MPIRSQEIALGKPDCIMDGLAIAYKILWSCSVCLNSTGGFSKLSLCIFLGELRGVCLELPDQYPKN